MSDMTFTPENGTQDGSPQKKERTYFVTNGKKAFCFFGEEDAGSAARRVLYDGSGSACYIGLSAPPDTSLLDAAAARGYFTADGTIDFNVVIPADRVDDPEHGLCGVIVDKDLGGALNGFDALVSLRASPRKLFSVLSGIASAVRCLLQNGIALCSWDCHQVFYDAEYDRFQFVFDGAGVVSVDACEGGSPQEDAARAFVSTLICALCGAVPYLDGAALSPLCERPDALRIDFSSQSASLPCSAAEEAIARWKNLPAALAGAVLNAVSGGDQSSDPLARWAALLNGLAQDLKVSVCPCCGAQLFSAPEVCPFCGGPVSARRLFAKWLVAGSSEKDRFCLSFGADTVVYASMLSPGRKREPVLRIVYSPKRNILALQNVGRNTLTIDYKEKAGVAAEPDEIYSIRQGMAVRLPGEEPVKIVFLGYEQPPVI